MTPSRLSPIAAGGRLEVPAPLDALAPVLLLGVTAALSRTPVFRVLVGEDAVYEWAQVAAFVAGAVWCVRAAPGRRLRERVALRLAAGTAVVVVGEELAWGTRALGVTGTALQEVNRQGEFTLHNVGSGLDASFLALAVASALAALLVAAGLVPAVPRTLAAWFALPAVYGAWRLGADVTYSTAKLSEVAELALAAGFARAAWCVRRSGLPLLAAVRRLPRARRAEIRS